MSPWLKSGLIGALALIIINLVGIIPLAGCCTFPLTIIAFFVVGLLAAYWMDPPRDAGRGGQYPRPHADASFGHLRGGAGSRKGREYLPQSSCFGRTYYKTPFGRQDKPATRSDCLHRAFRRDGTDGRSTDPGAL